MELKNNPHTIHVIDVPTEPGSIQKAIEAVRSLRAAGAFHPVTLNLAAGDHVLKQPIHFTAEDEFLTVTSAPNEKARILGGVKLENFVPDIFNGVACLSAVIPEGIGDFSDLYVNGKRADYTRYPENGVLDVLDVEVKTEGLGAGSKWFIAKPGDIPNDLRNPEQVIVSFCHYWIDEHSPIASYDPDTGKVVMQYRSRFNISGTQDSHTAIRYYLENVAHTFGKPNQWYRDGNKVYYCPEEGMGAADMDAYIPCVEYFLDIEGTAEQKAGNITIKGVDFAVTKGDYKAKGSLSGQTEPETYASDSQSVCNASGALRFACASDCQIEDCKITLFGLHGVSIDTGCDHITISGCELSHGGAGGVRMIGGNVGCDPNLITHDITVEHCTIHHCGRRYFAACGILMMHTSRCKIVHNEIFNLYYSGISCGWCWGYDESMTHHNYIAKNHIHHLGSGVLSDMGGIYLLGRQKGTKVCDNYIHHVTSAYYGGWGLYTDEGSSHMLLSGNLCHDCSDNCYHQHYGSQNVVCNNIFAYSGKELICVTREEPHTSISFLGNIIYTDGNDVYHLEPKHLEDDRVIMKGNLFWDSKGAVQFCHNLDLSGMQNLGLEQGSVIADPCFADPENRDFTMTPDSPAWKMGFVPLKLHDVGPMK